MRPEQVISSECSQCILCTIGSATNLSQLSVLKWAILCIVLALLCRHIFHSLASIVYNTAVNRLECVGQIHAVVTKM